MPKKPDIETMMLVSESGLPTVSEYCKDGCGTKRSGLITINGLANIMFKLGTNLTLTDPVLDF